MYKIFYTYVTILSIINISHGLAFFLNVTKY